MDSIKKEGPPAGNRQAQESNHQPHDSTPCNCDVSQTLVLVLSRLSSEIDRLASEREKLRTEREQFAIEREAHEKVWAYLLSQASKIWLERSIHEMFDEALKLEKNKNDKTSAGGFNLRAAK